QIVCKRKWFLAGNACLIVDLEAAAREDAAEQGINLEEMDEIDREIDRLALLNMANMRFSKRMKQEPRELFFIFYFLFCFVNFPLCRFPLPSSLLVLPAFLF